MPQVCEGDFLFTRSIQALYPGGSRATYKAPKGRMLVLVAVEVASDTEPISGIRRRVSEKIRDMATRDADDEAAWPELTDFEQTAVFVRGEVIR